MRNGPAFGLVANSGHVYCAENGCSRCREFCGDEASEISEESEMRVLVAYDGSESSQAALDDLRLAGLGKSVEAIILSVAEVWLPPPESSLGIDKPFPAYTPPEVRKAHEITAQEIEKMSAVANEANTGLTALCPSWKVSSEARSGSPWDEVTKKANELQANLIVVGSHGRSAWPFFVRKCLAENSQRSTLLCAGGT